ncbi:FAD-binding oxidoreductase [candidate division KSB1 bacterium]|nr:FAD-binding oxidoreductase [candidate division KSB1 bacterium]
MYNKVDASIIEKLTEIVGKSNVVTDREDLLDYSHDEYSLDDIAAYPDVVVKPQDVEAVSKIVKLCNANKIPLTARGSGTGLCGACVPSFGGVVITFENMQHIIEIDAQNLTATVESGLMLMDFYPAIEQKGLFFPPHPGDESATVGGVIATNAGGARAVKYGVIRNFVTGIEVVLPNGEIVNFGGKFVKNSTGYSLMHLMIGSEGTLGIITKATIALMAPPKEIMTLVVPYENLHDAISTVPAIIEKKILPMAVEFLERETAVLSGEHLNKTWPCAQGKAHLMIIVDGSREEEVMNLAETISEVCLANNALDVFIADTKSKQKDILDIRSGIYEAMRNYMLEILDITVPRSQIAHFVDAVNEVAVKSGMWLPTYGHAADGNVHTHLMRYQWQDGKWIEIENWEEKYQTVRKELHDLGKKYKGICSGEHGIGIVKKEYLKSFLEPEQIELMRGIKKTFDPNTILNPGKIFD